MILINSIPELIDNIIYLEGKLICDKVDEQAKAKDLIKQGMCFLRYSDGDRILFAPSRFIGYKENTISEHIINKPHGSITTPKIIKILGQAPQINNRIDKEYKNFCEVYDILPNPTGNFGNKRKFWNFDTITTDVYGEIKLPEGRKKYVKHLLRERNPRIRQIAISRFLVKNKTLYCEACLFDFEKKYGKRGKDFIECHHTIPLSKMIDGHKTKPEDIVLLCSNCHRMVHRGNNWLTLKQLKEIIKAFDYAEKIKTGKLKGRPAEELLNEL